MKIQIDKYTFNPTARTVVFLSPIPLERFLLITNTTSNKIIYSFADPLLGGVVTDTTLTLTCDTSTMQATDALQIFVDDGIPMEQHFLKTIGTMIDCMERIVSSVQALRSEMPYPTPASQIRVILEGGTVSSITNVAAVDGQQMRQAIMGMTNVGPNANRSHITIS